MRSSDWDYSVTKYYAYITLNKIGHPVYIGSYDDIAFFDNKIDPSEDSYFILIFIWILECLK